MFLSYRKNSIKGPPKYRPTLVLMQNLSHFSAHTDIGPWA